MLAQIDTVTHSNMGAIDTSTKYLTINSAYGSSQDTATGQEVDVNITRSSQNAEAPEYEDMDEVRKAYRDNRNEFELSENRAYSRTEDVQSYYDDTYNIVKNE